ncbi:MAG TPA: acylphosphatase [Thermoleophilaceae bacterium]|nr:acylphosphatase [Thermoleophilaceae bacterium]
MSEALVRRRVVAHGRVQGVFFRDTVRREAQRQGVQGWVENRADGAVEAVLEGTADAVAALVRLCERGPPGANVERLEVFEEASEGLAGFSVR